MQNMDTETVFSCCKIYNVNIYPSLKYRKMNRRPEIRRNESNRGWSVGFQATVTRGVPDMNTSPMC